MKHFLASGSFGKWRCYLSKGVYPETAYEIMHGLPWILATSYQKGKVAKEGETRAARQKLESVTL